jgi:hypothetical protein
LGAISRPLIRLGRLPEAQKALIEVLRRAKTDSSSSYDDRLSEIDAYVLWTSLLIAEGRKGEALQELNKRIRDAAALSASRPEDLTAIYYLSILYRQVASITSGQKRRDALLHSAAAWHSWPATSYTRREEQMDLAAAGQQRIGQ